MKAFLALGFSTVLSFGALQAAPLSLSGPVRTGSEFNFTLTGSSNDAYIIQASTNLIDWRSVLTDRNTGEVRPITIISPASRGFYRAVVAVPMFTAALAASEQIAPGNLTADSFDSADPSASTNGLYDPAKASDRGDVAAYVGLTNSLTTGNVKIKGTLRTGPQASVSLGAAASVGSAAWVDSGQLGIEPGHYVTNMVDHFPPVSVPFTGGFVPSPGTVGGIAYDYVLSSGDYYSPAEVRNKKIIVTGNARWHLPAGIKQTGASVIIVATNGRIEMYVGWADVGGNGIINHTGNAANFWLFGKTNCTNVNLHGNGTFSGAIYSPNAHITLNGGGSGFEDFVGSVVAKSININGHFRFHYDENLKRVGPLIPAAP